MSASPAGVGSARAGGYARHGRPRVLGDDPPGAGEPGTTAVYVAVGLTAMAAFLLAGIALMVHLLQPSGFVSLSMIAAALLLGSIAKLESAPPRPRT